MLNESITKIISFRYIINLKKQFVQTGYTRQRDDFNFFVTEFGQFILVDKRI